VDDTLARAQQGSLLRSGLHVVPRQPNGQVGLSAAAGEASRSSRRYPARRATRCGRGSSLTASP
jgi:hypothetical protein